MAIASGKLVIPFAIVVPAGYGTAEEVEKHLNGRVLVEYVIKELRGAGVSVDDYRIEDFYYEP